MCRAFGLSRQAYYQEKARYEARLALEARVLSLVRMLRNRQPRLGTRKLWVLLQPLLAQEGLKMGRDRLFALLGEAGWLIRRRRKAHRTTWAGSLRFPNRIAGLLVTHKHQVWVTDITYLSLQDGHFVYLFLVMDLYSRFILGWSLGESLDARHALTALQQALHQAGASEVRGTIHHSDHGVQYTSRDYQAVLADYGILASMGAIGNSYDNAYAERVIGILKQEYGLDIPFADIAQARQACAEGISLYNSERPHQALNYACPAEVYQGTTEGRPFTVYNHQDGEAWPILNIRTDDSKS